MEEGTLMKIALVCIAVGLPALLFFSAKIPHGSSPAAFSIEGSIEEVYEKNGKTTIVVSSQQQFRVFFPQKTALKKGETVLVGGERAGSSIFAESISVLNKNGMNRSGMNGNKK